MSQHGYRNPLANGLREEEILDPPPSYQYNYIRSSTPNVATTQLLTSPPPPQNPFEPQMETQTQTQTQTQPHLPNTNNQVRIMPMPSNTQSFRIYLSQTDIRIHFGYPLHFVVFHSIFMTIISIVQICVDLILMSEDNSVIISIGGGVWSGLFLILTLFVTLMTTSYRNSCLILTSIFLHMFALFFTFLINIVPNTISLLDSNCSFDLEHCKSMLVFKMTTFLLASGILNMIMCAFYSIFMYSRLFHESNSNIKNVTQTPQMGQRTMNNAPQEYPQHRNPFESNYAANNPNYQTF